jgi:glutathione peroxidase
MRTAIGILALALVMAPGCENGQSGDDSPDSAAPVRSTQQDTVQDTPEPAQGLHQFSVTDIRGREVDLARYRGKTVLVVNVASRCGHTPQYAGLQDLYDRYKDRGLVVIGFPANNFGNQEPGSNEQIREFCTSRYSVTFPMMSKISVKGTDQSPLYAWLTDKEIQGEHGGPITWNFNKFLIGPDGRVLERLASKVKPTDPRLTRAIEASLPAG